MKTISLVIASMALCACLTGCNDAQHEADLQRAIQHQKDVGESELRNLEEQFTGSLSEAIGLRQGESVGIKFLTDCKENGYLVKTGDKNASGFAPYIGYDSNSSTQLSRRVKAECDSIVATENRLENNEHAREKAKDDAYNKKHPVAP